MVTSTPRPIAAGSLGPCQAAYVRRIALIVSLAVVVVLVAAQVVLPPLAENRVEDRLTEGGGTAEVSIDAFPAARLLLGDGDGLEVTGNGLDLDLDQNPEVLKRLDGFDRVDMELADFRVGPFEVDDFVLSRDGSGPYTLLSSSTTTAVDLIQYTAGEFGAGVWPLLELTGLEATQRPIPIELDLEMESDDGRVQVVSGGGTVAGYPIDTLAELITSAIVVRL
jgi:hypothetical protein